MEWCSEKHKLKANISSVIDRLISKDCSPQTFDVLKCTKEIYEHIHRENKLTQLNAKSHRKLLIDGFDEEQIFQQIELLNKSALLHFNQIICRIDSSKFVDAEREPEDADLSISENFRNNSKNHKDEYVFDDDSDSSLDDVNINKSKIISQTESSDSESDNHAVNDSEFDEDNFSDSPVIDSKNKALKRYKAKSIVDDQFFKLSDLKEFLKKEDLREEKNLEDQNENDDVDLFQDDLSDSEGDEEESSKNIMYEDFFDPPECGDDEKSMDDDEKSMDDDDEKSMDDDDDKSTDDDEESIRKPENDELSFNEDDEMPEENPENNLNQTSKTAFELEQENIKKAISNYEDALIKKPEWHLTGEVAATARPKDSLLHQETDFDVNAKPVLIEDNILNEKIENAIKTIIKNKAFSDGQRKFKPNDITSYKKEILLEQTKSKKSLAAVYEDEYLKKKYGEQEEEDPKHVEIKKMMDSLFPELQALFNHVPKPAVPDIKIVSNLPAVTVEEVAPTSISDMTLLAPEEIKKKSGLLKGKTERTDTDRKRERRKKKILQRKKFKKMQTEENDGKPQTSKTKKVEKMNTLKKLQQHRNTKIADMGSDKIKSSKDFFSRLQDTVNTKVSSSQTIKKKRMN